MQQNESKLMRKTLCLWLCRECDLGTWGTFKGNILDVFTLYCCAITSNGNFEMICASFWFINVFARTLNSAWHFEFTENFGSSTRAFTIHLSEAVCRAFYYRMVLLLGLTETVSPKGEVVWIAQHYLKFRLWWSLPGFSAWNENAVHSVTFHC